MAFLPAQLRGVRRHGLGDAGNAGAGGQDHLHRELAHGGFSARPARGRHAENGKVSGALKLRHIRLLLHRPVKTERNIYNIRIAEYK